MVGWVVYYLTRAVSGCWSATCEGRRSGSRSRKCSNTTCRRRLVVKVAPWFGVVMQSTSAQVWLYAVGLVDDVSPYAISVRLSTRFDACRVRQHSGHGIERAPGRQSSSLMPG